MRAAAVLLPLGAVLTVLTVNLLDGWDVDGICPGTDIWCDGQVWQLVAEWLPWGMVVGQILVVLAMGLSVALLRERQ